MASDLRPNAFLSFPITNGNLLKNLYLIQNQYLSKDNRLEEFLYPLESTHISLLGFHVDEQRKEECKLILKEIFENKLRQKKLTIMNIN